MKKLTYIFSLLLVFIIAYACEDSSLEDGTNGDGFDRKLLTKSWVDNLFVPAITDFQEKITVLNTNVIEFTETPNENLLIKVRTSLLESAKVWQHVEMFIQSSNVDGLSTTFSNDINTYPVNLVKLEENLSKPIADIRFTRTLLDATQGLPTIDYLVNGLAGTDEAIVENYKEEKYLNYLRALTARMLTLTASLISNFETVKNSNINSTDNTVSSYFSMQINDYVQYTEKSFREAKIATPSGTRNRDKFPNISVEPRPEAVESLYSPENSKILYLEAYNAIKNFYYGKHYSTNENTVGLQEYLQFLGASIMVEGSDMSLNNYIESLFDNIDLANNDLGDNFFEQTQTYNPKFDAVFDAIQEYVVTIKGNVISAFTLTIDFADNDGD